MIKRGFFSKSRLFTQVMATIVSGLMLMQGGAWGAILPPPFPIPPLSQILVPGPNDLAVYVKDRGAAIKLGKALFWDMQAGSDGVQSCATCHFRAGADIRMKNQINPGPDGTFNVGTGPNYTLQPLDFPFHDRLIPDFFDSPILRDADDIGGSQGIRMANFVGINPGSRFDTGNTVADPVFNFNGVNVRQVTGRNAPATVNGVFYFTTFRDGRANNIFNGQNPFGPADLNAGVWFNNNGSLVKQKVEIRNSSLASQATGPPLSSVEMSYAGRTFPLLGRKMLSLTPLAIQTVHPNDSVLGPLSLAVIQPGGSITGAKGLNNTYSQMIVNAFQDNLWNANTLTPDGFTQMEANFSLFWGLAIQLYEATLVSDQTPFDQFLAGNDAALTAEQKLGLGIFYSSGRCFECHGGPELTNASFGKAAFVDNQNNEVMNYMFMGDGVPGFYDEGFYNVSVRPTAEDVGRGGTAPFINPLTDQNFPLSFCRLAELQLQALLPFSTPLFSPPLPFSTTVFVDGAFMAPSLRNVELTAPYMHNGSMLALDEAVDFYTRGGNFPIINAVNLSPYISQIDVLTNSAVNMAAMVSFLKSLTDERVRNDSAPFDHPELLIPEGEPEVMMRLPARDASGVAAPLLPTVTLNPVTTPTGQTSQFISGTKEAGAAIQVKVNNDQAFPADTAADTTWSTTVTGLVSGSNAISVTATDVAGGVTTLTADILVNVPTFTINAAAGPSGSIAQAGVASVASGDSRTYTITPNAGFSVVALVVDGTQLPGAITYTFTNVTADHYINAYFAPSEVAITASAAPNGSISPAGATVVTPGSNQTYTITPNSGFVVASLVVDGAQLPGATAYTFTNVTDSHYINAYFVPLPVSVTISAAAGPDGAISPAGATAVAGGSNQTYTITPNAGFTVMALVVDGAQLPGATSYTFSNVVDDHYINAYFTPSALTVTAAAAGNGTISPAGAIALSPGGNMTYTITPNAGSTVAALVVDGTVLAGTTTYTFTNVQSSHYINAYFQ